MTTASAADPLIRAVGVRKSFPLGRGRSVEILHGIDLDVACREFLAIMGASGSGKSTLLCALSGIDPPSEGTVVLDGVDLAFLDAPRLERLRLERIGFVFQQPHLVEGLTLRENAMLPAFWLGRSRRDAAAATQERLERLGIAEVADLPAAEASGGQRQRAGIARALVNEPDLIIADEPTGALDSVSAASVLDILAELHAGGLTVVMVTHDPDAAAHADRIVRVVDGRLEPGAERGAPGRLARPRSRPRGR